MGKGAHCSSGRGLLKGPGSTLPPPHPRLLPSLAVLDREQRSQRVARRPKVSRGQSPQLPISASLEFLPPPSPGTEGCDLAGSAGVNYGQSGGEMARPLESGTPPHPQRPPRPGRVSLLQRQSAAVGEEGAAPSPCRRHFLCCCFCLTPSTWSGILGS